MSDFYKLQYNGMTLAYPGWNGYVGFENGPTSALLTNSSFYITTRAGNNTTIDVNYNLPTNEFDIFAIKYGLGFKFITNTGVIFHAANSNNHLHWLLGHETGAPLYCTKGSTGNCLINSNVQAKSLNSSAYFVAKDQNIVNMGEYKIIYNNKDANIELYYNNVYYMKFTGLDICSSFDQFRLYSYGSYKMTGNLSGYEIAGFNNLNDARMW